MTNEDDVPIKKFHWMDMCIKCDKGGKLLTCHDNGCPVVVHQDCLGCEAQFDEVGNFYCPFCVYKRATQEFTQAERKVVLAKKTLSMYLDGKGLGTDAFEAVNVNVSSDIRNQSVELEKGCHEMTSPECIMKDKEAGVLLVNKENGVLPNSAGDNGGLNDGINRVEVLEKQIDFENVVCGHGDECCSGEGKVDKETDVDMNKKHQFGNKIQNDAIQTETVTKRHQDARRFEEHKIMEENVEAVEEKENEGRMDEVQNQEQAHKTADKIVCKESAPQVHIEANRNVDDTTASTCMDTSPILEKVTGAQAPCVSTREGSSRMIKSVQIKNSSTSRKSSKVAKPPTIFSELPVSKEKRKRLAWKVEEEEMLKKGFQKYSKLVNKNIPWQKILEEGRAIFEETRTPADLKDKWRSILSKDPLFELS